MKLRTVIADDEQLARHLLKDLLSEDGSIELIGECKNGVEVAEILKSQSVDLLFLDIQMPGITGLEVIDLIGAARMPPTVFVTAHNEHAVRAFEVHAIDYLTKPVEPRRLKETLIHVRERIASKAALVTQAQIYEALLPAGRRERPLEGYLKRILVPDGIHETVVPVSEIDWIEAADYYSCLHVGPKSYLLHQTTKQLAASLDPARFVRVHRSTIVNIDRVRQILREGRADFWVIISGGGKLKMSKAGWQDLLAASRT